MMIGLVGKPSVGKSSFYKAATLANVDIANYPFTTIKPNKGCGFVKIESIAKDFGKISNPREGYIKGDFRFIPVELIDVAGLVPGASEGAGMGNQFLDDLRQANVLIHVIDASGSTNEKGDTVETLSYDPAEDIKFLEVELDLWYVGILKKGWVKLAKTIQQTHSKPSVALAKQLSGLSVTEPMVEDSINKLNLPEKSTSWTDDDLMNLATELRKLTKPIIIAANKADVPGALDNIKKLQEQFPEHLVIPCSAESELALREASKHDLIDYVPGELNFTITDLGKEKLTEQQQKGLEFIKTTMATMEFGTGVQEALNESVFNKLEYIAISPGAVGNMEDSKGNCLPDCFLMPPNTTALDFAYRLHTDFGDNFIKAIDVRRKMPVGKDHLLKHRDVVEIMSNK